MRRASAKIRSHGFRFARSATFESSGDMIRDVVAPLMFPSRSSYRNRAAFARSGPASPVPRLSSLLFGPPTPLRPSAKTVVVPRRRPTQIERRRGLPGYWVVLFHTCRGPRPRRVHHPHAPWPRAAPPPSTIRTVSALGTIIVSRLPTHGPSVRAPTHRRGRRRPRRKTRYRPARLWLWSGGISTLGTTDCISGVRFLLPCRPASPGRTRILFCSP